MIGWSSRLESQVPLINQQWYTKNNQTVNRIITYAGDQEKSTIAGMQQQDIG